MPLGFRKIKSSEDYMIIYYEGDRDREKVIIPKDEAIDEG